MPFSATVLEVSQAPCPYCAAEGSRLTLLTTMVTYFVCAACARRWEIRTPVRAGLDSTAKAGELTSQAWPDEKLG